MSFPATPTPEPPSRPSGAWLLVLLDRRPSFGRAMAIILGMVGVIGWLDYLTGVRASLELFYLVPITLSVAWIGWRVGCGIATLSIITRVVGDLLTGAYRYPLTAFWNRLMDLLVYFVLIWVLHALLTLRRRLEQRVRERTAALEQTIVERDQLQTQLFEVSRRERSAIGHDLHDGLGQHLTATSIAADLLASRLAATAHAAEPDARTIVALLQDGIAKTRQIARGLLLSAIEPDELVAELEELTATLGEEHRITCRFQLQGTVRGIDAATSSHLFYIAQEAALNALRHARSSFVEISLVSNTSGIELTITDNGRGLPAQPPQPSGMGLRIMAHRAQLIGGAFALSAVPGGGTRVQCRVPTFPLRQV